MDITEKKEQKKVYNKKYYQENKEQNKKYYQENKEQKKKYYQEKKEKRNKETIISFDEFKKIFESQKLVDKKFLKFNGFKATGFIKEFKNCVYNKDYYSYCSFMKFIVENYSNWVSFCEMISKNNELKTYFVAKKYEYIKNYC